MKRILLLLAFSTALTLFSQQDKKINYSKQPAWIAMMTDPNANYFEAIKAYDAFWKGKEKPLMEQDIIGQQKVSGEKADNKKGVEEKKKEKKNPWAKYAYDCKRFERWKIEMKPYVQADGRILTKEERLKLWEEQRKK